MHAPLFETNVNPAGVGSETVTGADADGPLFVTVTAYVMVWPGDAFAGPVFRIERSLAALIATVAVELLLPGVGSVDVLDTEAVLESVPLAVVAIVYVLEMPAEPPAPSDPIAHGNAVLHPPVLETNVMPAGVGSATAMPVADDGPLFTMLMLKVTFWPGFAVAGPVLVICTSAFVPIVPVAVEELFGKFGSGVVAFTDAVFEIEPVAADATRNVVVIVAVEPAVNVPIEHGNGVVQAPVLETKVVPGGVESLTVTPVASDGPLFVTTIE